MKSSQRLDYNRLAEALAERQMAELDSIRALLKISNDGGQAFPEALVEANLVSDWDLARVVSDIFQLPFIPSQMVKPSVDLLDLFAPGFLQETGIVPLAKFGNVLTIVMPALVQADILALMSAETEMVILPLVGTVTGNRKWIGEHATVRRATEEEGWDSLFEEGDMAVQSFVADATSEVSTDDPLAQVDDVQAALDSIDFLDALDGEGEAELDPSELEALAGGDSLGLEVVSSEDDLDIEGSKGGDTALPPPPSFG